jgi:hypothetical protein
MGGDYACPIANKGNSDKDSPATRDHHAMPEPAKGAVVTANERCMVATVAGGLLTEPTTVEKVYIPWEITKIDVVPVAVAVLLNSQDLDIPFILFSAAGLNVSPPSVEKYILNATLLI